MTTDAVLQQPGSVACVVEAVGTGGNKESLYETVVAGQRRRRKIVYWLAFELGVEERNFPIAKVPLPFERDLVVRVVMVT